MNREAIYAAAFAHFATLTSGGSPLFNLATRKATTWDNSPPEDSPALYMMQTAEFSDYKKGLPTKWKLQVKLFVYVHTGANNDPTIIPSQILNPLLDAIQASIPIDDPFNNANTLGGLVSHFAIEGGIEIYEGNLGDQAVAIVPIVIFLAN